MSTFRALIVDDEKTYAAALGRALRRLGIECDVALDAEGAVSRARSAGPFQVVLLDNRLPDGLGLGIIPRLRALMPGSCILMMTAYESIEDAVEAMRLGAEDYVAKTTRTEPIVARVLEARERVLARTGYDPAIPADRDELLLGQSDAMRGVRDQLEEVAGSTTTPVLIVGEAGSGKGVAARYVHRRGHGASAPFVTLNCATGPAGPTDGMLLGRLRHTVSGGEVIEAGLLDSAADGVLCLDAVDEAPERLQKLLESVISSGIYRHVGSAEEHDFCGRVIACARLAPEDCGMQERLAQAIDVYRVTLPPLRERGEDVVLLADLFIDHFNGRMGKNVEHVGEETARLLLAYDFPGNVRELRNIVERAMIQIRGDRIFPEHLPERVLHRPEESAERKASGEETDARAERGASRSGEGLGVEFLPGVDTIESVEKRLIVQAMEMSDGVKSRAAKLLGISRFQLLRRLEKYGLEEK